MAKITDIAIVDSSGLVSLLNTPDSLHAEAVRISEYVDRHKINLVLPPEILAETLSVIGKKISNAAAITAGQALLRGPFVIPVPPSGLTEKTLTRLAQQKSSVSYIDCLVMEWADHYSTKVIFGFDAAFKTNGYRLPA